MRLGLIGCGFIGQKRVNAAKGHDVTIVFDLVPVRAAALAKLTGANVASSWQEVCGADVDAVMIATTPDQLPVIGLAALQQGKHVLIEKPGGRNAAELEPLAVEAAKRGLVAKVGFNHRFHPSFLKAKQLVDEGGLGPMMFVRGRYGHGGRLGYETEWRFDRAISGGGELLDQGTHLIDLSRWFLGDLEVAYGAMPAYYWRSEVEDNCFMALRGAAGETAWLQASWTEWKNIFSFEIAGRDGKLQVDGLGGSYGIERLTYYRMLPILGPPETTIWEYPFADTSWDAEFAEFASAIEQRRPVIGGIDDAIAVLRIVDQLYERGTA